MPARIPMVILFSMQWTTVRTCITVIKVISMQMEKGMFVIKKMIGFSSLINTYLCD